MNFQVRAPIALLVLAVLAAVVYTNSLGHPFTFDDHPIVENNPVLRDGTLDEILISPFWPGQPEIGLYRPVTLLSFALNRWVGGEDPFGYRVVNVALHVLTAWLVFLLVSAWFGREPGLVAGVFYLVHPIQSEAVNAIVGRAELLAGCFVMLSWYTHSLADRKLVWRTVSVVAYVLACLSKEHALVLPGFLVAEYVWLRQAGTIRSRLRQVVRDHWRTFLPYVVAGCAMLMMRLWAVGSLTLPIKPDFVDNPLAYADPLTRGLVAIGVFGRYVQLMLAPVDLSVDYTYNQIPAETALLDPFLWGGALAVGGLASLAYRSASGQAGGVFGLGAVVMLLAWLPISNLLFAIGTPMNERLMYLPMIGAAIFVGAGYGRLKESITLCPGWWVAAVVCLFFATRTGVRNEDWRSEFALFSSAVSATPNSAKAWFNFGNTMRDQANANGALDAYDRAISIHPSYAEVHYNRGVVYQGRGERDRAEAAYQSAIRSEADHLNALTNLGILYARAGDLDRASVALQKAVTLDPSRVDVQYNLGRVLHDTDPEGAVTAYSLALAVTPGFEDAAVNLALLHADRGNLAAAKETYTSVLAANPLASQAAYNLGVDEERSGEFNNALRSYRKAWEGAKEVGQVARYQMGVVFLRGREVDSAAVSFGDFLRVWQGDPKLAERARNRLSLLRD